MDDKSVDTDRAEHRLLRARLWQNREEFTELCEWWKDYGAGVCTLIGIGGSGKTAIVDRFLQALRGGYPLIERNRHGSLEEKRDDLPRAYASFVFSFTKAPMKILSLAHFRIGSVESQ